MSEINPTAKPVNHVDASYFVNARATYYPTMVEIYIPHSPYEKLRPGFELQNKPTTQSKPKDSQTQNEDDIERSLRRTKKAIKEYVLCNNFDLFATFTFKEDRENHERCRQKMNNWLKNQQKRHGKFEYLIVSELHKDPVAIHFHALLQNFTGKVKPSVNPHTGKQIIQGRRKVFELPGYTLGFTNVKQIDNLPDSQLKTGFYLMKYITKETPMFFGKNRYWASSGLAKPQTEDNPEEWYLNTLPDHMYQTEYGTILLFNKERLPK